MGLLADMQQAPELVKPQLPQECWAPVEAWMQSVPPMDDAQDSLPSRCRPPDDQTQTWCAVSGDGPLQQSVADAEAPTADGSEVSSEVTPQVMQVPPLCLSLTRPPLELPPQLAAEFEVDASSLGQGAYASVQLLRHRATGQLSALKIVEKHPLVIRNMLPQLQREVRIQGALTHPRILALLGFLEDEYYTYMLLEFCAGGTLRRLSTQFPFGRFPEAIGAKYFAQILQGVDFMHNCNVVHRDLKAENILLTHADEVRICDFGWSAEVQIDRALRTTCGTPSYWAPEIFEGLPQGTPVDLWALGNLIYEMLIGHQPFWGNAEELRMKVLSVDLRYPPNLISNEAISIFYCCLQRDPLNRVPAGRLLLEHPWVHCGLAASPPLGFVFGAQGWQPVWHPAFPPQEAHSTPMMGEVSRLERGQNIVHIATVIAWRWPTLTENSAALAGPLSCQSGHYPVALDLPEATAHLAAICPAASATAIATTARPLFDDAAALQSWRDEVQRGTLPVAEVVAIIGVAA